MYSDPQQPHLPEHDVNNPNSSPDQVRASTATSPAEPFGSTTVLRQYVAVGRRRWKWIVAGVVLGMLGGLISAVMSSNKAPEQTYFKATNTIVASVGGNAGNLEQVAFMLQSAEVQSLISAESGVPIGNLRGLISAQSQPEVNAIDVTAISTDSARAVALADTSAKVLMEASANEFNTRSVDQLAALTTKIDGLAAKRADLEAQIARNPAQTTLLKAELDSVINQYRLAYEQFSALAVANTASSSFSVFQPASAVRINAKGFRTRYDNNLNSRGSITGGSAPAKVNFSETDFGVSSGLSRLARLLVGGLVGGILGIATAFIVEVWDDRIRRRDSLEAMTGIPVIAEIPAFSRAEKQEFSVVSIDAPRSRAAELYRVIRTTILFSIEAEALSRQDASGSVEESGTRRAPVILVTSPSPGEGKTTTTANIAAVFAASGSRTLIVDCDYRKPSIGKYLAPIPDLEHPENPQQTRAENLWFIPSPRSAESQAVVIEGFGAIIEKWRQEFDIVFLDTPPMLTTNDATDLLGWADHTVLVIRAGQTRSIAAERVSGLLARFGAPVIGTVFNSCSATDSDGYYGSGYQGSGYYGSGYYGSGYYGSGYYGSGYYGSPSKGSTGELPAAVPAGATVPPVDPEGSVSGDGGS